MNVINWLEEIQTWSSCDRASGWSYRDGNAKGGGVTTGVVIGGPDDDSVEHCRVVGRPSKKNHTRVSRI